MPRIQPIDIDQAEGKAKTLLEGVNKAMGMTPNLIKTLAHSPAALEAFLGFGKALGGGGLSSKLRVMAGRNSVFSSGIWSGGMVRWWKAAPSYFSRPSVSLWSV